MNYLYNALLEAGFEPTFDDEWNLTFEHPILGPAEFPEWSQAAFDQIYEYALEIEKSGRESQKWERTRDEHAIGE